MAGVRDKLESALDEAEDAIQDARTLLKKVDSDYSRAAAVGAITAIRQGRYDDAVTTLEREFLPKWSDKISCQLAYLNAMGR